MEWTWRTTTESNMPNSPKLPNSVQEVLHEVSEPNPLGNAVTSEETHGNAVAGAATASAVAQPPVDTASLASSCTNKCEYYLSKSALSWWKQDGMDMEDCYRIKYGKFSQIAKFCSRGVA